jgi:hypothetical protein
MEIEKFSELKIESRNDESDRVVVGSDEILSLDVALQLLRIERETRIRLESQVNALEDRLQVSLRLRPHQEFKAIFFHYTHLKD